MAKRIVYSPVVGIRLGNVEKHAKILGKIYEQRKRKKDASKHVKDKNLKIKKKIQFGKFLVAKCC